MGKNQPAFIFNKWESRIPYYPLMNFDEQKICIFEQTWAATRSKGIRVALASTFGGGWAAVINEAKNQSLKYGGRKALGCISGLICGYFGSASLVLVTKSTKVIKCAKICHSVCSGGLDVAELCAATPIHIVEIFVFGRPVLLEEGGGFDLFSNDPDPIETIENLFSKK